MLDSIIKGDLTLSTVAICSAVSLGVGLLISLVYAFKHDFSRNVFITLLLTPVITQAIIMMVNGSIGMGVAVMGAFSLVRFRSVPGSSKDILFIFFAMATGIATGIGQIFFAGIFAATICAILFVTKLVPLFKKADVLKRQLKITIPEDLNYEEEFKPVFALFADSVSITQIKTAKMGSLFVVQYSITLKKSVSERDLINAIRIVNGNLPIVSTPLSLITQDAF